jgi:hypothetical protein
MLLMRRHKPGIMHSQISMTSKYAHLLPEVMTDAAERIGRALWGET